MKQKLRLLFAGAAALCLLLCGCSAGAGTGAAVEELLRAPDRKVIGDCLRRGWHDGWHTTPEPNTRIDFGDDSVNRAVRACEGTPADD